MRIATAPAHSALKTSPWASFIRCSRMVDQPTPKKRSSYRSASLPRPGVVANNYPFPPTGESAVGPYGEVRRWLEYGWRKQNVPDLGSIGSAEWYAAGQPAPDPDSLSAYLVKTTINQWTAELESHFDGAETGSGVTYINQTPPGCWVSDYDAGEEFLDVDDWVWRRTETWQLNWYAGVEPDVTLVSIPVEAVYELFFRKELTFDDVLDDVEDLYDALPKLHAGGPGYARTRDENGDIIDGEWLGYAFGNCPAGMGINYTGSGGQYDILAKCGCILYNENWPLERRNLTFDLDGKLSETSSEIEKSSSGFYRLELGNDWRWKSANILPPEPP